MTNSRIINLTAGWTFVLLGIAGLVLPVLQGFLFIVVGLLFLSKEYHWAHRLLEFLKKFVGRYFPRVLSVFENAERYLETEVEKMATEKGYWLKRIWLLIGIVIVLAAVGWLLLLLFGWLWRLMFK